MCTSHLLTTPISSPSSTSASCLHSIPKRLALYLYVKKEISSPQFGRAMAVDASVPKPKVEKLVRLYPKVSERETPLPRSWSAKDKYTYIGLSQNNLRVHYKGSGKNHKDAASVRTAHPIPAACGVYYFEIKVISKGRDGYMGIGLSASGVNLNRLPGWEKQSYGYHADDGCVFSSSGTGQTYGPTFTTGDTVGCGLNLVERSIFYTKNGMNIGTAVSEVPPSLNLYPTVGLQTPGEIVEANFGETPFVFDFEGLLSEVQQQIRQSIEEMPVSDGIGSWQAELHHLVLSYLVHHGYSHTAQVFASSTGQRLEEDTGSIRNRQRIQKLVMAGRVSEALRVVRASYPGLLEADKELLFRLKCRQFVEMIAGCDRADNPPSLVTANSSREPRLSCHSELSMSSGEGDEGSGGGGGGEMGRTGEGDSPFSNGEVLTNGEETEMEVDGEVGRREEVTEDPVDIDHTPVAIEKILAFGRDLQALHTQLSSDHPSESLKTLLQDSFSLLAYTNPHSSPVGYLLDPIQREPVCAALNSAILESKHLPGQPPLEFALGQAVQCLKHMSRNGLGAAAFTGVQDIVSS